VTGQLSLFGGGGVDAPDWPEGLDYRPEMVTPDEEQALAVRMAALPFRAFEFQGYLGHRRTVSYGLHYEFDGSGLQQAEQMPHWLLPLRERAATWAQLEPDALQHVLLTEYAPGAGIGWHRDRPVFGDVIGLSLLAPARLRFRRKFGDKWERKAVVAEPRSAYLLRGPAREEWQHSIAAMEELRYSITFRTLKPGVRPA
jgi:alkylated DNA repair dioxygenase AlkB